MAGREVADVADLGVGDVCWVPVDCAVEDDSDEMDLEPVGRPMTLCRGIAVDAEQAHDLDGQAGFFGELSLCARSPSLAGFEGAPGSAQVPSSCR